MQRALTHSMQRALTHYLGGHNFYFCRGWGVRRSYTTVTWLELPQMWFSCKELLPQPLRTCWQECFAGAGQPSDTTLARHLFWTLLTCISSPEKQATWTCLVPQWFLWLGFCEKRCRWENSPSCAFGKASKEPHEKGGAQISNPGPIHWHDQSLLTTLKGSWKQRSSYLLRLLKQDFTPYRIRTTILMIFGRKPEKRHSIQ